MATLAALQTEVELYGFSAAAYASRITTWLNEGQRIVARVLDLPTKETDTTLTLVANTNSYALPATFQRLLYVANDTDDQVLERITEQEYEEFDHTERGVPIYYFLSAGVNLILYPAPTAAQITKVIRVHYVGVPTSMVAAGDLTGFNVDYDYVLKAYALQEAYAAEDDAQMSGFWQAKFKERLAMMGEDQNYPDASGPKQVNGAWNF